jgi:hypothetical protein
VVAKHLRGEVAFTIRVENQVNAATIQTLGATNLADIRAQLSALTEGQPDARERRSGAAAQRPHGAR